MVALNFNAQHVKPNAALEPIPTGQYPVMITNSQMKPTKNGAGQYIELEMTIQGGEFGNRKVFDRLNVVNANQTAVDIAYATLSAICHVTGVMQLSDTGQLHGRPFVAVVSKVARNDQPGSFSNEVKGYKDINGNDPGFAGASQAPAAAQPAWSQPQGQPAQQPAPQNAPAQPTQPPQWAGAPNAPVQQQPTAYAPPQAPQAPMQPQAAVAAGAAGPAGAGAAPPWAAR